MPALSARELEKVLEGIFEELQQKGYINALTPKEKDHFIQNIIENLNTNDVSIQKEDLLDPKFRKTLCLSAISEVVSVNYPELKLNHSFLFKDHSQANRNELKNELNDYLEKTLTALNRMSPNPMTSVKIKALALDLSEHLTQDFMNAPQDQNSLAKNQKVANVYEEMLSAALENLFGGTDPRHPGTVLRPVTTAIGNLHSFVNYAQPSAASTMGEDNKDRFQDRSKPGYGMKEVTITNDIMKGLDSLFDELGQSPLSKTPNPFNNTPNPYQK